MIKLNLVLLIITLLSCKVEKNYYGPETGSQTQTPIINVLPSTSGVRTGSGGDGYLCYKNDQKTVDKVYLWDFIELGEEPTFGDDELSDLENLDLFFREIFNSLESNHFKAAFLQIKEIIKEMLVSPVTSGSEVIKFYKFLNLKTDDKLKLKIKNINDAQSVVQVRNKNCQQVQIARTENRLMFSEPMIKIDYDLFKHLPSTHKIGLLFHEVIQAQHYFNTYLHQSSAIIESNSFEEEIYPLFELSKFENNTRRLRSLVRQVSQKKYTENNEDGQKTGMLEYHLNDIGLITRSDQFKNMTLVGKKLESFEERISLSTLSQDVTSYFDEGIFIPFASPVGLDKKGIFQKLSDIKFEVGSPDLMIESIVLKDEEIIEYLVGEEYEINSSKINFSFKFEGTDFILNSSNDQLNFCGKASLQKMMSTGLDSMGNEIESKTHYELYLNCLRGGDVVQTPQGPYYTKRGGRVVMRFNESFELIEVNFQGSKEKTEQINTSFLNITLTPTDVSFAEDGYFLELDITKFNDFIYR